MNDPLEALRDKYWVNFWEPKTDNPKAPILTLVLKEKQGGESTKYPIWRDKEGRLYLGKAEAMEAKKEAPKQSSIDEEDDFPPF